MDGGDSICFAIQTFKNLTTALPIFFTKQTFAASVEINIYETNM
jgi:hypothetical protein